MESDGSTEAVESKEYREGVRETVLNLTHDHGSRTLNNDSHRGHFSDREWSICDSG